MTKQPAIKVLIVTRNQALEKLLAHHPADWVAGFLTATDESSAMQLFVNERPRIVVLDYATCGLDLLDKMVSQDPATEVIVINGYNSTDLAVDTIQKGACDFLPRPLDVGKVHSRIRALIRQAEDRKKILDLDTELIGAYQFESIVGRSPLMLDLFAKLGRVGPHFPTVLLTGETGTGKELVARALHNLSTRCSGPFATSNCSAIVPTLVESELFGHVRGAFTGATQDKVGIFEHANGGTVFLDEIGELPFEAQAKLLRVIQNHEIQRVGSPVQKRVDVRIVAATNRNLKRLSTEGRFRQDLYYRIAMVELKLPRLADRKEDLPLLQRHFVSTFSQQYNKSVKGITRRAQICLTNHNWPGNVRELENAIGNACMMTESDVIDINDLPEYLRSKHSTEEEATQLLSFADLQKKHLLYVLREVGGNKAKAAEILGISRTTLYEMLSRIARAEETRDGLHRTAAASI
jgi:DNA-binding NtrC family response regulator